MKNLLVALLFISCGASSAGEWSAPLTLGPGSEPRFVTGADGALKVVYEGENGYVQSSYGPGGKWGKAQLAAKPGPSMTVTDGKNVRHLIARKDDGIHYSQAGKAGGAAPVKIAAPLKGESLYPLYANIDAQGRLHLLYVKSRREAADIMHLSRGKGGAWGKPQAAAHNVSVFRSWQNPGAAMTPAGEIYLCSYDDLYTRSRDGRWKKEKCRLPGNYMPVKLACDAKGTVHFIYYSWKEKREDSLNGLYYASVKSGTWSAPVKIGNQNSERIPDLAIARDSELWAAWEDPDGNIRLSMKRLDR